jgi:LytS/YehU family sensor histidine kinase
MYQIQCDPEVDTGFIQVPPMLLQPYVENAIWHGLMLKEGEKHLWVHICQEDAVLVCTITDNGIGRKKVTEKTEKSPEAHRSMGMRITADRIALMQQQKQQEASIEIMDLVLSNGCAGGTEVIIKIPIEYDQGYFSR